MLYILFTNSGVFVKASHSAEHHARSHLGCSAVNRGRGMNDYCPWTKHTIEDRSWDIDNEIYTRITNSHHLASDSADSDPEYRGDTYWVRRNLRCFRRQSWTFAQTSAIWHRCRRVSGVMTKGHSLKPEHAVDCEKYSDCSFIFGPCIAKL